jgi:hypothetical protein
MALRDRFELLVGAEERLELAAAYLDLFAGQPPGDGFLDQWDDQVPRLAAAQRGQLVIGAPAHWAEVILGNSRWADGRHGRSVRTPGRTPARHFLDTFVTSADGRVTADEVEHANDAIELAIGDQIEDVEDKQAGDQRRQAVDIAKD